MRHRHLSKYSQAPASPRIWRKKIGLETWTQIVWFKQKKIGFNAFLYWSESFEKKMELGIILKLEKHHIEKELQRGGFFFLAETRTSHYSNCECCGQNYRESFKGLCGFSPALIGNITFPDLDRRKIHIIETVTACMWSEGILMRQNMKRTNFQLKNRHTRVLWDVKYIHIRGPHRWANQTSFARRGIINGLDDPGEKISPSALRVQHFRHSAILNEESALSFWKLLTIGFEKKTSCQKGRIRREKEKWTALVLQPKPSSVWFPGLLTWSTQLNLHIQNKHQCHFWLLLSKPICPNLF